MRITLNDELTLLGSWALNKHREDIVYLSADMFNYSKQFEAVKNNMSNEQMAAAGLFKKFTLTEFIMAGADPFQYAEAIGKALRDQQEIYAKRISNNTGNVRELTEKINQLEARINNEVYIPKASNLAENFIEEFEAKLTEKNIQYGKGFKYLDKYTNGIHRGQLIVLGARPSNGKSAMALQIARNVISQGQKVLYLPLEMTVNETLERLLLMDQVIEKSELTEPVGETKEAIADYLNFLEDKRNFAIYEGLNDIDLIEKKIKEEQPYLVVIDQLTQLKTAVRTKDIREKYTEITAQLKRFAIEYKVAILLLSQLNRDTVKSNKPTIENLHESDSTGQNADTVLLITREDEDETYNSWKDVSLYIAKQRQGESGKEIPLKFIGERYTFLPVELTDNKYVSSYTKDRVRH